MRISAVVKPVIVKPVIALVCLTLFAAPERSSLVRVEKMIDRRVQTMFDEPFLLLGNARGIYLQGTGAVFTAEMALVMTAASPFAPKLDKAEMERLRQKRLSRLPVLRAAMQDAMLQSASMLPGLPSHEHLVFGVTITRKSTEDNTGIPTQIVMHALKKELDGKNKAAIQMREF